MRGFISLTLLIIIGILIVGGGMFAYQNKNNLLKLVSNSPTTIATTTPTPVPTSTPSLNIVNVPTSKPQATVPPFKSITVNGFAYEDRNNDDIFNSDDPALPNMQLFLYDGYQPKVQLSTVFSDSQGNFSLTLDVRDGMVVHPTAYNNFVPKTGDKKLITSSSGVQFGFRSSSAIVPNQNIGIIEGNVFHDANKNLVRDGGENPVHFYKLYLQDNQGNYFNTVENAQTTDEGGHFKYINLPVPNTYIIRLSNDTGKYELLRSETNISLTQTNSQNTNVQVPVYKY